jgi:hypothetical protein
MSCGLTLCGKFMDAQFRSPQFIYLHLFALDKLHMQLPIRAIAGAFNLQPKNIRRALQDGDAIPKGCGEQRYLKTTPRNAYLNGLRRMPRIVMA